MVHSDNAKDEIPEEAEAASAQPQPADGAQAESAETEAPGNPSGNPADAAEGAESAEQHDAGHDAANPVITDEELQAFLEGGEKSEAEKLAEERLEDLLRLQAEYANYRKRVERDRVAVQEHALAETVKAFLPVLDDLDRAEQHGDLGDGPFAVIAHKIRSILEKKGLDKFGEAGEAFDPQLHEAIARLPQPGAESETIADVVEAGYRIGERLLRPAKVAVAVPAED